jgi:hypothetical protein
VDYEVKQIAPFRQIQFTPNCIKINKNTTKCSSIGYFSHKNGGLPIPTKTTAKSNNAHRNGLLRA